MPDHKPDERVIIIAPIGPDATAIAGLLGRKGYEPAICQTPPEAASAIICGAGALLLTEEAIQLPEISFLLAQIGRQPAWSELPLILLANGGEPRVARLLDRTATAAGSLIVLERPIGTDTLIRAVEVALRSRRRQYEVRDLLASKARLAAIVEFSEDAIISKDLNGIITTWNRGAERLFGYTAKEAIGEPITMLIPEDRLPEETMILERIRQGVPVEHYETVRRRKDGDLLDISLTVSPIANADGRIVGASKIARDITQRTRSESALRESEDRYRTLVEQVKDYAIFRTDTEGRPTSWNEGVHHVFGFKEMDFVGADVLPIIFTPDDLNSGVAQAELKEAAERGTASDDRWMRRKDGTRFYASGVTTALRNDLGDLVGYSKVVRDRTSDKRTQDALDEARAKLEEHAANLERIVAERTQDLRATNDQLEAFVYSIAHDLRAPLRSMIGYSQLLLDDYCASLDDTGQHLVRRIQASSEFMDKLLLDLLAYGRAARAELELVPVPVSEAWEIARFQSATQIEQTAAHIETNEPLGTVIAHEATLGQCLANLLSNGLKFVEPGATPRIRCWTEVRGEYLRVWVQDNGIGIAPQEQQRAFRVFERLHGSRYSGTGIGLSIVRKGIERMGGAVGLESELGKGSKFWLELPKVNGG